jgi:hypothetical protein
MQPVSESQVVLHHVMGTYVSYLHSYRSQRHPQMHDHRAGKGATHSAPFEGIPIVLIKKSYLISYNVCVGSGRDSKKAYQFGMNYMCSNELANCTPVANESVFMQCNNNKCATTTCANPVCTSDVGCTLTSPPECRKGMCKAGTCTTVLDEAFVCPDTESGDCEVVKCTGDDDENGDLTGQEGKCKVFTINTGERSSMMGLRYCVGMVMFATKFRNAICIVNSWCPHLYTFHKLFVKCRGSDSPNCTIGHVHAVHFCPFVITRTPKKRRWGFHHKGTI